MWSQSLATQKSKAVEFQDQDWNSKLNEPFNQVESERRPKSIT